MSYFEEIENEESEIRPIFIANACHVCKAMCQSSSEESKDEPKKRLLSCSGCRLIAYCGTEHQKQHWSDHKDLCKIVQNILKREGKKTLFAGVQNSNINNDGWKSLRYNYMSQVEGSLKRPMCPYEREMFLYPRVCATCHMDDGSKLSQCPKCQSVFYCCDQHLPARHADWCDDLKTLMQINLEHSTKGNIDCFLPHRLLENYEELPPSLKEFLVLKMVGSAAVMSMGKPSLTMLTEMASYPLTVLWGLQEASKKAEKYGRLPEIKDRTSLVIHIVGAELPFEGHNLAKWDVFFLNVLPELRSLYVVFTGPELMNVPRGVWDEDLRCPHCVRNKKQFVCDFQPNTFYHDYVKSSSYIKPDVIVAFNCGLYRETGFQGSDSWSKTLPHLLKEGVPVILTAYTAAEAPLDLKRLENVSKDPLEVLLSSQKNPYRSFRPCRNFVSEEESPLIFKNQFITVVKSKAK